MVIFMYNLAEYSSIAGLLVAFAGFTITIKNIKKTNKLAKEANETGKKVRKDMQRLDTMSYFSTAISVMNEIKQLQRNEEWRLLLNRYAEIRNLLITIKKNSPDLNEEQEISIQKAIQEFKNIEKYVEKSISNGTNPEKTYNINKKISDIIDDLKDILEKIRNKIGMEQEDVQIS